jgi:hypothetical protein
VNHASKACLICDHLLKWNKDGDLTKLQLKALYQCLSAGEGAEFESLPPNKAEGHKSWMAGMFLSPRGIFDESKG